jgi:hypothetical protein
MCLLPWLCKWWKEDVEESKNKPKENNTKIVMSPETNRQNDVTDVSVGSMPV